MTMEDKDTMSQRGARAHSTMAWLRLVGALVIGLYMDAINLSINVPVYFNVPPEYIAAVQSLSIRVFALASITVISLVSLWVTVRYSVKRSHLIRSLLAYIFVAWPGNDLMALLLGYERRWTWFGLFRDPEWSGSMIVISVCSVVLAAVLIVEDVLAIMESRRRRKGTEDPGDRGA